MKPSSLRSLVTTLAGIAFVVSSCQRDGVSASQPAADAAKTPVPHAESSGALRLSALSDLNDFRAGSSVALVLENLSQEWIWFPAGYGITISVFDTDPGKWREVVSLAECFSAEEVLLSSRDDVLWATVLGVWPDVGATRTSIQLRIAVAGRLYRDGETTDQTVQSHVDLVLEP